MAGLAGGRSCRALQSADKRDLLVVSSGAIALGRTVLKLPAGRLELEDSQAAAAVGQIALARTWTEALSRHGITAGQVLVTLGDTEERRRYLNARSTIDQASGMARGAGHQRERYGRHHRNSLRRQRPARRARRHHGERRSSGAAVRRRWPLRRAAGQRRRRRGISRASNASRRRSRRWRAPPARACRAAACRPRSKRPRSPLGAGTHMVIASGHVEHPLDAIAKGARCTWFSPPGNPVTARKKWIAGSLESEGHADHRCRRGGGAAARQ